MGLDHFSPGNRIVVRDAEWIVRSTEPATGNDYLIEAIGLSPIVKDQTMFFLTSIEKNIRILKPEETNLVTDVSSGYVYSTLYIETLLRKTPPTTEALSAGVQGAMDNVPFQEDPARLALKEPRCRILIADAVGLGKTIEAGILLTELIKRGRGKRILVLALKSMLVQFQKELWSRFSIPLVRLDSAGIQRIRNHISSNYNPFFYYDKIIISIDTLKREDEYRVWLEDCAWDVIVIDEAHNVAQRGSHSQRARLAQRISYNCDSMILLSATPHDL